MQINGKPIENKIKHVNVYLNSIGSYQKSI